MITSIDAEKALDKIQPLLLIVTLSPLKIEGNFLSVNRPLHNQSYSLHHN